MKLWHRNLALGSPINGFLKNVRWDVAPAIEPAGGGVPAPLEPAPEPSPEPTPTDWRSSLDPDIKDHPCLKDFKSEKEAVKAYVGAQKLIGVDKLPMPPKDAKPEVREQFLNTVYDRLGRPKEAKEYKITDIKLPEGVDFKIESATIDALKVEAHKLGLLPHQVDGLYKWYMMDTINKIQGYNTELTKGRQDSEAKLRSEFGSAYDAKVIKSQQLLNKLAGEDFKQLLDTGFGNNPAVVRFMSKMADLLSEDAFEKGGSESTMTPKEAETELSKVRAQLLNMEQNNPEYKLLLQRRNDLMEMAHAG